MAPPLPRTSAASTLRGSSTPPAIILSREVARLGSEPQLRRARDLGQLHKLAPGAYVDTNVWGSLSHDDQYRLRVRAFALLAPPDRQFSHSSAAAMLRLPTVGPWPREVHVTAERGDGGVTRKDLRWHGIGTDAQALNVEGVMTTSLARTVVDLACSSTFVAGVVAADDALRKPQEGDPRWGWDLPVPNRGDLDEQLTMRLPMRGSRSGFAIINFADGLSGSAAESEYRVQFHTLGFPVPVLQHPVFDAAGLIGYLDFWFPTIGLGLEIDGAAKYSASRRYQRDLDPWTLLKREKKREDRLRNVLPQFTRMEAALAPNRRAIAVHLAPFGLVPQRTRPT